MRIIFIGRGIKISKTIRNKVRGIFKKHEKLLEKAIKIDVELKKSFAHSGVKNDLTVEITIFIPKVILRVEESGSDFYEIFDRIDPIIRKRLVKYHEFKKQFEGKESWKLASKKKFEDTIKGIEEDVYADQTTIPPVITRYKRYSQNSPMNPSEAIERMELLGHEAFLFKNIETKRYSMVYKRRDGGYGLVEPKEI
jgi:putative sigma-54 modulation protein